MLQFFEKKLKKNELAITKLSVNEVKQASNQNIRYSHKVNDTIVYAFCLTIIGFTFKCRSAHGTLRFNII